MVYMVKNRKYSSVGIGETLEQSVKDYENDTGDYFRIEECSIFKAEEIEVEVKFVEKLVEKA